MSINIVLPSKNPTRNEQRLIADVISDRVPPPLELEMTSLQELVRPFYQALCLNKSNIVKTMLDIRPDLTLYAPILQRCKIVPSYRYLRDLLFLQPSQVSSVILSWQAVPLYQPQLQELVELIGCGNMFKYSLEYIEKAIKEQDTYVLWVSLHVLLFLDLIKHLLPELVNMMVETSHLDTVEIIYAFIKPELSMQDYITIYGRLLLNNIPILIHLQDIYCTLFQPSNKLFISHFSDDVSKTKFFTTLQSYQKYCSFLLPTDYDGVLVDCVDHSIFLIAYPKNSPQDIHYIKIQAPNKSDLAIEKISELKGNIKLIECAKKPRVNVASIASYAL